MASLSASPSGYLLRRCAVLLASRWSVVFRCPPTKVHCRVPHPSEEPTVAVDLCDEFESEKHDGEQLMAAWLWVLAVVVSERIVT